MFPFLPLVSALIKAYSCNPKHFCRPAPSYKAPKTILHPATPPQLFTATISMVM
jgi:hypothetical protein